MVILLVGVQNSCYSSTGKFSFQFLQVDLFMGFCSAPQIVKQSTNFTTILEELLQIWTKLAV